MARGVLDAGLAQRVRIMARLQSGDWVSGQNLARELRVSRSAVHKHVDSLRGSGAPIASVRGSGYRLTEPWDSLAPEAVLPLLLSAHAAGDRRSEHTAATELGLPYLYEASVGSTNQILKDAAARDLPAGGVAVTDHQVEGRGRLGRRWVSEAGKDVTFSLLLRPDLVPEQASRLVVTAGVAVVDVVSGIVGGSSAPTRTPTVGIKWPNDVLVDGCKVCGILAEASMDMDRLHWVVIGVGLNVNGRPAEHVPPGQPSPRRLPPVSLAEFAGGVLPRAALLSRLLHQLSRRFCDLAEGRWGDICAAYETSDGLRGTAVSVCSGVTGEAVATGIAIGIGDLGQLLLREDDGTLRAVSAGEVTVAGSSTGL